MEIITRKEAKEKGLTRYFTGKPCKHGHVEYRQTSKGECIECKRLWDKNNHDKIKDWHERVGRELAKQRRAENRAEVNRKKREWYRKKGYIRAAQYRVENRERISASFKGYATKNKDKLKEYRAKNKARYNAHCRNRQARIQSATLESVPVDAFVLIYEKRARIQRQTGVEYHVDHYYPINGEHVCGLHVPWNIQIIPADENIAKGNKMPEEFYGAGHTPPMDYAN